MTSFFDSEGRNIPCTVIQAGPCVITHIKTNETDGYNAIQLGFDERKEKNTTNALKGHFQRSNTTPKRKLVEFRDFEGEFQLGGLIKCDLFAEGEFCDAIGTSKGKGFQGVVKRHNFSGVGMQTHGQHNRLRAPGSMGASSFPSRVLKGMRMAGRTGFDRVKVQNLQIVKVMPEQDLILIKGAIPGPKGGYVILEK